MTFSLVDLESVNTNCKKKIGELNVCKSEISNLSKIVEERLEQVKASKEDVTTFKGRNDLLERDLQLAKEELDNNFLLAFRLILETIILVDSDYAHNLKTC